MHGTHETELLGQIIQQVGFSGDYTMLLGYQGKEDGKFEITELLYA